MPYSIKSIFNTKMSTGCSIMMVFHYIILLIRRCNKLIKKSILAFKLTKKYSPLISRWSHRLYRVINVAVPDDIWVQFGLGTTSWSFIFNIPMLMSIFWLVEISVALQPSNRIWLLVSYVSRSSALLLVIILTLSDDCTSSTASVLLVNLFCNSCWRLHDLHGIIEIASAFWWLLPARWIILFIVSIQFL